jgi:8-hydroxy-5-deazaflavin:NADPH oxidoreductase
MMKITIIGTGNVGQTIASKLISLGYKVMIGTRNVSEKLSNTSKDAYGNPPFSEWHAANSSVKLASFAEAAAFGEIIINATKGENSISALKSAGEPNLNRKVIIDIANPLDFSNGTPPYLIPELSNTNSLGEEIQKTFPETKVVKTLNTMWCGLMVNPNMIGDGNHINYLSGNDADAKAKVRSILNEIGWKNENLLDLGDITGARATEAILPIWLRVWNITQNGAFNFRIVN